MRGLNSFTLFVREHLVAGCEGEKQNTHKNGFMFVGLFF